MKRKTAKEILAESFRELAEKKKVDKITVRDIAENCGYSTTTFYRHFKDKYDLIVWEHTQYVSKIMDRVGKDGYSWNQTFIRNMAEINCNALKERVMKAAKVDKLDEETEIYIRFYCWGTTALNCEWILG